MLDQRVLGRNPRTMARIELLEMITGLCLVFFMFSHVGMLSTILFGEKTMNTLAVFLERTYLAQVGTVGVAAMILLHFYAAGRKLPARLEEQRAFWALATKLRHGDTWLWLVQVVSGLAILVFAGIHLFVVGTTLPIEAEKTGIRVATAFGWLYAPMAGLVGAHLGIGLYRILVKWTSFRPGRLGTVRKALWIMTALYVALAYWVLATDWSHGLRYLAQ